MCEEKHRLLTAYDTAVKRYSTSVSDITLTRGKISKREYDSLVVLSEKARMDAQSARKKLNSHIDEHAC